MVRCNNVFCIWLSVGALEQSSKDRFSSGTLEIQSFRWDGSPWSQQREIGTGLTFSAVNSSESPWSLIFRHESSDKRNFHSGCGETAAQSEQQVHFLKLQPEFLGMIDHENAKNQVRRSVGVQQLMLYCLNAHDEQRLALLATVHRSEMSKPSQTPEREDEEDISALLKYLERAEEISRWFETFENHHDRYNKQNQDRSTGSLRSQPGKFTQAVSSSANIVAISRNQDPVSREVRILYKDERAVADARVVEVFQNRDVHCGGFGHSVAVDSSYSLVGAPTLCADSCNSGAAYLIAETKEGSWENVLVFKGDEQFEISCFGIAVFLNSSIAIVSALEGKSKGNLDYYLYTFQFSLRKGSWVWYQTSKKLADQQSAESNIVWNDELATTTHSNGDKSEHPARRLLREGTSPSSTTPSGESGKSKDNLTLDILFGVLVFFIVIEVIVLCAYWWQRRRNQAARELGSTQNAGSIALGEQSSSPCKIPSSSLWQAERGNEANSEGLADISRFVYQSSHHEEHVVAVRRLPEAAVISEADFFLAAQTLTRLDHPNIPKYIGYSSDRLSRMLVSEFITGDALESKLNELTSNEKILIIADISQSVEYLHRSSSPALLHGDLRSRKIILDPFKKPYLLDCGIAKLLAQGKKRLLGSTPSSKYVPGGKEGYAAPEYFELGILTPMADVYSLGVVALELLTGLRAVDHGRPPPKQFLVDWVRPLLGRVHEFASQVECTLGVKLDAYLVEELLPICSRCLALEKEQRPSSSEVSRYVGLLVESFNAGTS